MRSLQGHAGGYVLTRPAAEITVLDVVEAVDGARPAFVCTEIRQRGPPATPPEACTQPCAINRAMMGADEAWRASLRSVTIATLAQTVNADYGMDVMGRVGGWLGSTDG